MAFDVEGFLNNNVGLIKSRWARDNAAAARQVVRKNIRNAQELAAIDGDTFPLTERDAPYFDKRSLQYDPTKVTDPDAYRNSTPTWGLTPAAKSVLQSMAYRDAVNELLENPDYVRYLDFLEELEAAKNAPELNPSFEYIPEGLNTPEVEQMRLERDAKVKAQTAARENLNRLKKLVDAPENKNAAKYKKDIDKLLADPKVALYLENKDIPEDIGYFDSILAGNDIHNPPHKMIIDTYNNFYDKLMDIRRKQDVREARDAVKNLSNQPKINRVILPNDDVFVRYLDSDSISPLGGLYIGKKDPKTGSYNYYSANLNLPEGGDIANIFKQYDGVKDYNDAFNNTDFISKYISANDETPVSSTIDSKDINPNRALSELLGLAGKLNAPAEEKKDDGPTVIQRILPNGDLFAYYSDNNAGSQIGGMLKGKLDPKTGTYKIYHADINQGSVEGKAKLIKQYGGLKKALNNPEFIEKYISADTYHNGPGRAIDSEGNVRFTEDTGTNDPKEALKKLVNTVSSLTRSEARVENRHTGNHYKDVQTKTDDFIKFGDFDYSTGKGTKGLLSMTKNDAINWYKDKYKLDDKKAEAYVKSLLKKYKLDVIKDDPSLDGAGRIIEGGVIQDKDLIEPRVWKDESSVEEASRRRKAYLEKLTENSKIRLNNLRDSIVKLNNKLTDTSLSPEEREKASARLSKLLEKSTKFNDKYKFGEDSEGNTTMTVTYKPDKSKNDINNTNKYKKGHSLVAGDRSYGERVALYDTKQELELVKKNRETSFNDLMKANNELLALENELSTLRSEKKAATDQDEKAAKAQEIAQKTLEYNAQKQEVKELKKTFKDDTSQLNILQKRQNRLQGARDKQTNAEIKQLRDYTTDVPPNRKLTGQYAEENGRAPKKKGTDTYKYTLDGDKTLNEAKKKEDEEKAKKEEKLNSNILAIFEGLRR